LQQLADFLGQSGIEHAADALIDSAVKLLASRIQPDQAEL